MNAQAIEIFGKALTALLVFALGLQLAAWTWKLLYPDWRHAAMPVPAESASSLDWGRRLLGNGEAPATEPSSGGGIRLKGVFAVDGKTLSAAVVNLGGRDQAVLKNQEISKGVTLAEVERDHIVVSRAGVRERIDLERFGRVQPGAAAPSLTGGPAPTAFRLNVEKAGNNAFALSRQELNSVLQDPRQLNFLGRIGPAPQGGVRVEDAPGHSLAGKLGLQAGDILVAINGQPINSQGDLARLYGQFESLTSIRAEVRRAGTPLTLTYSIRN
ncbi:MAG TPA: type II secretion system protein N [Usitatibacteraceae bacterium]|nr:type II secretion system protein N [Usitatibacteraceae bacterium]